MNSVSVPTVPYRAHDSADWLNSELTTVLIG